MWDFINTPCTVKKTYQGHVNKNYSVGGCFGLLRSMRKVLVNSDDNEYQEEQWEEADSVAFVTSASEDGAIVMWDVRSKEVLQRIEAAHRGVCFWVDVHGETGTMVSCGEDGRIVVYRHRYPVEEGEAEDAVGRGGGGGGGGATVNGHHDHNGGDNGGQYPGDEEEVKAVDEDVAMADVPEDAAEMVQTNGHVYPEIEGLDESQTPALGEEGDITMEG